MKAVICAARGDVHIHTPGTTRWEICQCRQTGARWEDPNAGSLIVACRSDRDMVRCLGLNNQMLLPAITTPDMFWEMYRQMHEYATEAPDHIFDKSRAGCWAVVYRVGSASDTRWATDAEYLECFPQ